MIFLIYSSTGHAQENTIILRGEGNVDQVKLMWVLKNWQKNLEGFHVHRRIISGGKPGNWVKLSQTMIFPESSFDKNLSNVTNDVANQNRLKSKYKSLKEKGKIKEVAREKYVETLLADPQKFSAIYLAIAMDYDFALFNGFGYSDINISTAESYEYGLFTVVNGVQSTDPVDVFVWKYGTQADASLNITGNTVNTGNKSRVQIKWKVKVSEFKAKNINGFNVYRIETSGKVTKLNETPVWMGAGRDTAEISFYDYSATGNRSNYAVAPITLFGTEGNWVTFSFDPKSFAPPVTPPDLISVTAISSKPGSGVALSWEFKKEAEDAVSGFYIERADLPGQFRRISTLLGTSIRKYTDNTAMAADNYFKYRVVAIQQGKNIAGTEVLFIYKPDIIPPTPRELKGKYIKEDGKSFIHLSWEKPLKNQDILTGYHLYSSFPPGRKLLLEGSIPMVDLTEYKYPVYNSQAARYSFAITSVSRTGTESPTTDTVVVLVPTQSLPNIAISPFSLDSNIVTLQWSYRDIADLKGFRIFADGALLADEKVLDKATRLWRSNPLEAGKTISFELQAVTESGLISKKSQARDFIIK